MVLPVHGSASAGFDQRTLASIARTTWTPLRSWKRTSAIRAPSCEKELVILASQPIRRVRCSDYREVFTLDRRIGGALCLLPFNAKVYAGHRALVERLKNLKRRGVVYVVAAVVVGCSITLVVISPMFLLGLAVVPLALLIRDHDSSKPIRRRQRRDST